MTGPTTDPEAGAGPWPDPGTGPGHTGRRAPARRPVIFATAVVAVTLLGALGGSWAAGQGTPAPPTAPAPGSAAEATPAGPAPAERLASALARLAGGYRFETTVSVNGQTAARAIGRRTGTGTEMTVDAGSASITYRLLPPRSWVQQDGGDWLETEGTVPDGDPLAALEAPLTVEAAPDSGDGSGDGESDGADESGGAGGRLRATYPPSAFGGTGDTPVRVTLTIAADGAVTISYATALSVGEGAVVTVLRPEPDQPPIVEPSAGT